MRRARNRFLKAIVFIGVLGGIIGAMVILSRPRQLLERATRVWKVAGSEENPLWGSTWISRDEVILQKRGEGFHRKIEQVNVKTRATKPLPGLAKQMVEGLIGSMGELMVSPDPQRALWIAQDIDTSFLYGAEL